MTQNKVRFYVAGFADVIRAASRSKQKTKQGNSPVEFPERDVA